MQKGITIENKINNYLRAAEDFNKYNDFYRIECFMNFDTLDIYVHNLEERIFYKVEIFKKNIKFYPIKEIISQYYLLVEALYNDDIGGATK